MKKVITALLLSAIALGARARTSDAPATGVFSDLRCVESEGDVLGLEITLLGGFNETKYEYFALVQFAEGAAEKSQLVAVERNGNEIAFTATHLGESAKFSGRVTKNALIGKFGKALDSEVRLPRRSSFWQTPGNLCYQ